MNDRTLDTLFEICWVIVLLHSGRKLTDIEIAECEAKLRNAARVIIELSA